MAYVQIIEGRTSQMEALAKLGEEWEYATEGRRTLQRSLITQDRNEPGRFLIFAFFDSYESAMKNSQLPETAEFAQKQAALLDGPPVFHDLDVIDDRP